MNCCEPTSATFGAPMTPRGDPVRGEGAKDLRIPVQSPLVQILESYLDSRAAPFPSTAKRRSSPGGGLTAWATAPRGRGRRLVTVRRILFDASPCRQPR